MESIGNDIVKDSSSKPDEQPPPQRRRLIPDFPSVPFTPNSLDSFFALLESAFEIEGITDEPVQYHILARDIIQHEIGDAARDLITSKPKKKPYTALKTVLLQTLKPKSFTAIVEKMQAMEMGTLKPSEYLKRLKNCANDDVRTNPIFVEELEKCWRNALPATWHPALILASDLNKAADAADALYEAYGAATPSTAAKASSISAAANTSAEVAAIQKPSSLEERMSALEKNMAKLLSAFEKQNKSDRGRKPFRGRSDSKYRSPNARLVEDDLCFYHHRFGKKAYRCVTGCRHYAQYLRDRAKQDAKENDKGAQQ